MLLAVSSESSYPVQLGAGTTRLPSGAEVLVEGERVQLRAGRSSVTVNDVEVHGSTSLHPGDVVGDAEVSYLVLPGPASTGRPPLLLDHWGWQRRVEEEVAAAPSAFSILLGRSGAFGPDFLGSALAEFSPPSGVRHVAGSFGRNGLEVLVLGDAAAVEGLRQFVSDRAAGDEETVRWGLSSYPRHGGTGEELWSIAVERLLGLETRDPPELVWSDPCMTRLRAFAEHWSRPALALIGGEGVGRESFARLVRALRGASGPVRRAPGCSFREGPMGRGRGAGHRRFAAPAPPGDPARAGAPSLLVGAELPSIRVGCAWRGEVVASGEPDRDPGAGEPAGRCGAHRGAGRPLGRRATRPSALESSRRDARDSSRAPAAGERPDPEEPGDPWSAECSRDGASPGAPRAPVGDAGILGRPGEGPGDGASGDRGSAPREWMERDGGRTADGAPAEDARVPHGAARAAPSTGSGVTLGEGDDAGA